jgi:hypothetical protein
MIVLAAIGYWLWVDDHRGCDLDRDRILAGSCTGSKGPQLFGYFLFSLIFFPAALIVAYVVSDRTAPATV